jgi:hypothetical protein
MNTLSKAVKQTLAPHKANGAVVYRGISRLDGKTEIVVIVTGLENPTNNKKTGDMLQAWVLIENTPPHEAVKSGLDYAICGDCIHRGGTCYVTVHQAPLAIWKAYKRGKYTDLTSLDCKPNREQLCATYATAEQGRNLRIGAYGDPSAVPVEVWQELATTADTTTGYTHQWKNPEHAQLKYLTMASADSVADFEQAQALGWRTFRVKNANDHLLESEVVCPSTTVGLSCADCGACKGLKGTRPLRSNIVIDVHGRGVKAFGLQA